MNAGTNPPSIDFQLCFAGAACSNAAAKTGKGDAGTDQPREQVPELGEFDLQLAFAGSCSLCENVQDQLCAIEDLSADDLLDLPELCRGELVVEHHQIDPGFSA